LTRIGRDFRAPLQAAARSLKRAGVTVAAVRVRPPSLGRRGRRPQARPLPESEYRTDLQGLRAVAVLLVALDHAGVSFLKGGYVGVDVFFVLSGFLITGLLLAGASKRGYVSLVDFYARRARRILPAAALTLVVTTVVADQLLNYVRAKQVAWDSFWAGLFAANIHFAHQQTDYFARGQPPSSVLHYWSLAVEEQFYLVWPALLSLVLFGTLLGGRSRAARRRGSNAPVVDGRAARRLLVVIVLGAVASLIWSIHSTNVEPAAAYFSPFARAWELALGSALALGTARLKDVPAAVKSGVGWLGLLAIGVAAVVFSATTPFPGSAALLPTVGAALVIAAGMGRQQRLGVGRLLAVAPMRYIGDRSYAFYLWHWPPLVIALVYEGHELEVGVKLLLLLGAFLLSVVTYRLFENPIRRARWSVPASALLIPSSVAAVILVALLTVSSINAKASRLEGTRGVVSEAIPNLQQAPDIVKSPPLATVVAAVKAASRGAKLPAGLTPPVSDLVKDAYQFPSGCVPAADTQTTSDICHLGDDSATKSIVLFGDSHAQMWMPTILAMAQSDAWVVIPLVKSGCVPSAWIGKGYIGTPKATLGQCHAWYRWAVQQAKTLKPDVTLMTGCCATAPGATAVATRAAFASLAAAMKGVSKNVMVIADDEGTGSKQPVDCLLARNATMKTCLARQTNVTYAFNDGLVKFAKTRGFDVLKTRGWFCYQFQCPMVVGHTIVYRDTGHITQAYAVELAAPFRGAFRRCIFGACPA
jgi:peptidoglycan/LPS O-acetylase OafA/YrhL